MIVETKVCKRCDGDLPVDCFGFNHSDRKYRKSYCKPCDSIMNREYRIKNKDKRREATKRYLSRPGNREAQLEAHRAWRNTIHGQCVSALNQSKVSARRRGGQPCHTDLEIIKSSFAGFCAICSAGQTPGKKLHMDHDHISGAFRGWLCSSCNHLLGMAKDSQDTLIKAARYLGGQ
jgi:hypothetical protein